MRWDGPSTISRSAGSAPAAPRRRAGSNACGEPSVSRLVSELRLEEASTLEDANAVLATYLPRYNRRFGVPAEDPELAWRPLPAGVSAESVFCFTVSAPGGQRRHARLGRRAARPPALARRGQPPQDDVPDPKLATSAHLRRLINT